MGNCEDVPVLVLFTLFGPKTEPDFHAELLFFSPMCHHLGSSWMFY